MFQAIANKLTGSTTFPQLQDGQTVSFTHTTPKNEYKVVISMDRNEERIIEIKIEQKFGLSYWKGSYSQTNVQQITKKTGHQLDFDFFVTLLRKALSQRQLDCYIDILTTQDLEVLKNRKNGANSASNKKKSDSSSSKRYMILTYMTNETKYHYPLSLAPVSLQLNQNELKQIYNKLRVELQSARAAALNDTQKSESFSISYNNPKSKMNPMQAQKIKEIDQHKSQNQILKSKLARLEQQVQKKKANIEIEAAIQRTKLLKQNLETQNLQLVDWKNNIQQQQQTHDEMKKQLVRLHKKICGLLHSEKQITAKKRGEEVQKQLNVIKRNMKKNTNQIDKLKKQLETSKNKVRQLELKTKKLNSEKQVMRKGRRGPYSSAGSVRSYGSYNSYSSSKRSTGGYSNASSSKPKSNYSYNSYNYGRNLRR